MALVGRIRVPSDKSISHRAVLFSALAHGTSQVNDLLPSDDVKSSLAAVATLGAQVDVELGERGYSGAITGFADAPQRGRELSIDCGNSGTTTRLLLGMLAGLGVTVRLHGDASLSARPMERVLKPLRAMGACFECEDGTLPLRVLPAPTQLVAAHYDSPQASAQVKSAVLLAGLSAHGTTSVAEPAKSRDHTERMLPAYGVPVAVDGLTVSLEGPAHLHACDMRVPADPSSAAFVAVAAALVPGSDVVIEQVALNPTRAGAFKVMQRMGACVEYENLGSIGAEQVGDVHVRYSPTLVGTRVAPEEVPTLIDEVPVLSVLAACAAGETVFENVGELRVKESDRFAAIREALGLFGVETREQGNDLTVVGGSLGDAPAHVELPTYHDHRLAMSWHIAGLAAGNETVLDDPACVSVSWPGFFEAIERLSR